MKLMWLARLASPDMLQVTAWLADLHHWIVLWCWFLWGWWSCLLYVWRLDSVEWPRHSFPIAWMSKIHNGSWNSGNGHHTLWWWGTTGRIVLWSFQEVGWTADPWGQGGNCEGSVSRLLRATEAREADSLHQPRQSQGGAWQGRLTFSPRG